MRRDIWPDRPAHHVPAGGRRGAGCEDRHRQRVQGHGRRQSEVADVLRIGGGRQLRAEQDHCRAVGGHDDHELHARDRSHCPRFARHRHDDAAGDSRGAAAPTGNPQSERHAGEHRVAAAARDLGHPVGFPDRAPRPTTRRSARSGSAARRTTSCRGRRLRRHRRERRTGSTATSTIRTWSSASKPGWSTPWSAISMSTRRTATIRTLAG